MDRSEYFSTFSSTNVYKNVLKICSKTSNCISDTLRMPKILLFKFSLHFFFTIIIYWCIDVLYLYRIIILNLFQFLSILLHAIVFKSTSVFYNLINISITNTFEYPSTNAELLSPLPSNYDYDWIWILSGKSIIADKLYSFTFNDIMSIG